MRILLIEDDEDDYLICKHLLHEAYRGDVDLVWGSSVDQGIELALQFQFDVYLVDYRLGEKNGIDWLTELTACAQKSLPPSILLTGTGGQQEDMSASNNGFSDFISKAGLTAALLERSIRYARHQRQLLDRLANTQASYKQLHDDAFDAILLLDGQGIVLTCNPSAATMFAYGHAELIGMSLFQLLSETEASDAMTGIHALIRSADKTIECQLIEDQKIEGKRIELTIQNRSGSDMWIEIVMNAMTHGGERCFSATMRDISEQKKREETLKYVANHDLLSGMYNRRYFLERLEQEVQRARRFKHQLSIMMLDVDFFKAVNDSYGHAAGDVVLKDISQQLRNAIRSIDIAARWGGEEFIILLPETDAEGEMVIADKVRKSIADSPIAFADQHINVTISIGITSILDNDTVNDFINRADKALYHVKEDGRNGVKRL